MTRFVIPRGGLRGIWSAAGAALLLLVASPAAAQSPPAAPEKIPAGDWLLSPLVEVRTRGEYRRDPPDLGGIDFYGRFTQRVRDAWVVLERTRLGLGVDRGPVRAQVTLQDARALGSPGPTATLAERGAGIGQVSPYEAYLEAHGSGGRPAFVRLGRQAVIWGEGRLIGAADFSPTGRSLDAARAHAAVGNFDFEGLAALLEPPAPLGTALADTSGPARSGVQLYGLTGRWTIDPLLRVEAFALLRVSRSSGVLDGSRFAFSRLSGELYTGALRASGEAKGWAYGAEAAYQLGRADALAVGGQDVSAWAAAAHLAKTLDGVVLTPTFRLSGSYASGDDGSGSTYKQFDPLLADPQRFHGMTDLFGWSNAMDVAARATVVPTTDTVLGIEYRYARLADAKGEWIGSYLTAIGSASGAGGTGGAAAGGATSVPPDAELGHELSVSFAWRPWTPLELRAGWSGMILGDGARAIMAAHARGHAQPDNSIEPAKISEYVFGQATLTMP